MTATCLATNLLGRAVRLHRVPEGAKSPEGTITTLYLDADGLHFLVLVQGQLVPADAIDFVVLAERDW